MKKKFYFMVFSVLWVVSCEKPPVNNSWKEMAVFPSDRFAAVGFSIGSKGYIGTGVYDGNEMNDFWEYNPTTNRWIQKANFPGGTVKYSVGFSIGNRGYIAISDDISTLNFWEYNPDSNTWTNKAGFEGRVGNNAVGFSIGNKGYIGTGNNQEEFWEYNPAKDLWTQKANFAGGRRSTAVGFSIGNKGYVGTGQYQSEFNFEFKQDFWEYDPDLDSWTRKADFEGGIRYGAVGFSIGNKGYIGTGFSERTGGGLSRDFWEYDPAINSWTRKEDIVSARGWAIGFSIGNKGYVGTGYVSPGTKLQDFWEFTPN